MQPELPLAVSHEAPERVAAGGLAAAFIDGNPQLRAQPAQSQPSVLDRKECQLALAAELAGGAAGVGVVQRRVGAL